MPLSEHEQRLLEQMERALHQEDPKLASTMRHGSNRSVNGRQVLLGSLGVVIGLAALVGGVATSLIIVGVVGFLFMLGGTLLIGAAFRASESTEAGADGEEATPASSAGRAKAKPATGGFMSKVEDRWRKRRETDGF